MNDTTSTIRELLNAPGVNISDVAEKSGVNRGAVSMLRSGHTQRPLLAVAEALVPVLMPGHSLRIVKDDE